MPTTTDLEQSTGSGVGAEALVGALAGLERACDALAGARTQEQYLALIDSGQAHLLDDLDCARREAQRVLVLRLAP